MRAAVQNACNEFIDKYDRHVMAQGDLLNVRNTCANAADARKKAADALVQAVQDTMGDEWTQRYFVFGDKILEVSSHGVEVRRVEK